MTSIASTESAASPLLATEGKGLKRNYLSFPDVLSQSIGTIAPSGTPGLVIPVGSGEGGCLSPVLLVGSRFNCEK